jgi:hypothetical protein
MRLGIAFAAFLFAGCADVKEGLKEGFIPGYAFNKQLNQIRANGQEQVAQIRAQAKFQRDFIAKEEARIEQEPPEQRIADLQRLMALEEKWIRESEIESQNLDRQMREIDRQMDLDEIRNSIDDLRDEIEWQNFQRSL